MTETSEQVAIPERAFFKASEVCDLAKVQPYVLRSWEAEFKDLGVQRSGSAARVYRRVDVELVLRIKHLLLVDGLTLAGVRRKLDEEAEPPLEELALTGGVPTGSGPVPELVRERIGDIKRGLRSLLTLLDAPLTPANASNGSTTPAFDFALAPAATTTPAGKATKRGTTRAAGKTTSPDGARSS
jgi:DNA-binding transcriptional MerR regulator